MEKPLIYFAGKVSKNGYRSKITPRIMSYGNSEYTYQGKSFIYGGPFAASCDHGCFHGPAGFHGMDSEDYGSFVDTDGSEQTTEENIPHEKIIERCYSQISNCDIFYCFINSLDCWGTLLELGYARAFRKPIYIVMDIKTEALCVAEVWLDGRTSKDEMWFLKEDPQTTFTVSDDEFALLSIAIQTWAL